MYVLKNMYGMGRVKSGGLEDVFSQSNFSTSEINIYFETLRFLFFFFVRDSIGKPTGKFNIKT